MGSHQEPLDTRREAAHLLETWKKDSHRIASFDRDRNGRIDLEEWEVARQAAHRELREQQLAHSTEPQVNVVSNPNDWNRPFLISTVHEGRLIQRYQLSAALFLLIAMVAGSWLAWAFA